MKCEPKGIIPAMVTPLDKYGHVNRTALHQLTNYLIHGGVHGLFPIGSTGEWYGLSINQKKVLLETVIDEAGGRVPIYAGTGAITTKEAVELTRMAADVGVDAVSVLTPVFIKPTDKELYDHYQHIARSVELPVLLYNNPERTGISLSVELVERLSEIENIIGIKDSGGDITLIGEYIRRTGEQFSVLAGKDTTILGTLVYGGKGAITASANVVPQLSVKIYEEYLKGNLEEARKAQFELAPFRMAFNLGSFPVVLKEALNLIGIDAGPTLPPVGPMSEENRVKLKKILQDLGGL